eukprot:CAMPEP_0201723600 /NCGR_PEP_ID=MMETSP0593-20130828/7600_1 /ASSEMBLY_ACC=CAM_ASM_000672 /TAXON_ID=267983 /ORGANISM="Skeletonema japonicum, Strain CCMP2506" /LENGTH=343 /DNA_ID=CAMNT_0048214729 /DNA_START=98 /DNA_END=1129 /DNA_ORIENTATION=-
MDRRTRQIIDLFCATSDKTPAELQACIDRGCPWDQPIPARMMRTMGERPSPTIPINIAAQYQRHDNLAVLANKALKEGRPELLESPDLVGRTPAHLAVQKGNPLCLGVMAKAGANLHRAIPHVWQYTNRPENNLTDPNKETMPIHHALVRTVVSYTTRTCLQCVKNQKEAKLQVCTQCKMAYFCGAKCQKKKWSEHKNVCKEIRKGADLVTFYHAMPRQKLVDEDGFLPFDEVVDNDLGLDDDDNEEDYYDSSIIWEWYDPGAMKWNPYPKSINQALSNLQDLGSPRYMYKPGDKSAEGMEEREQTMNPPNDVATNHAYYSEMIDHHIYTGCGRMMRKRVVDS